MDLEHAIQSLKVAYNSVEDCGPRCLDFIIMQLIIRYELSEKEVESLRDEISKLKIAKESKGNASYWSAAQE